MAFYDKFPYTNFQELNLDWLTQEVSKVRDNRDASDASAAAALASEKAAKASETAAAASQQAAANSETAAAGSAEASANSATEADNYVSLTRAQVNLLQSRVDNIIPSGTQTEGNTELLDIRVAEDGQIYDSAGNAVRGQVRSLKNALNLPIAFDTTTDLEPGAFNVYGLDSAPDETYKEYRSTYIDLHDAYSVTIGITFEQAHPIAGYCCAYDANKTPIPIDGEYCREQLFGTGKNLISGSGTFVLPANTVYIRFFVRTFNDTYTLSITGSIKPEKLIADLQNVHDAVDAEITVTNNNVSDLNNYVDYISPNYELIDYNDLTPGFLNGQGGIYNPSAERQEKTSQVIGINPEHTYKFVCDVPSETGESWLAVGWWDANDKFLGRTSAIVTTVDDVSRAELVLVPKNYDSAYANAAYMRVSWRTYGAYMAVVNDITFDGKSLLDIINTEETGQSKTYKVDGGRIDVSKTGFDVEQLGFKPLEESGKYTQGMAVSNGVIFQGYGNGTIDLIDLASGTLINSFNASAGHCGSLSFANVYPDGNTDFPYLYVASFNENKTFVYNVTRTECTLEKTYIIPESVAGYCQETCIDKLTNHLWCMGHKNNSYSEGGGLIISEWDLTALTDNGNETYTPTKIQSYELPWVPYLQCIQILNGQMFAVFGNDASDLPEQLTHIMVINMGTNVIKAELADFPTAIKNAEPEGIDFIFNSKSWKYDAILATRRTAKYYQITF